MLKKLSIFFMSDLTGEKVGLVGGCHGAICRHKKARTGRADVQNQESVIIVIIVCIKVGVVEGVSITVGAILDHHVAHSLGCAMPGITISVSTVGDGHVPQVSAGLAPCVPGVVV